MALLYANGAADERSHTQLNSSNLQLVAALQIESLSIELGPDNIRVNAILPGLVAGERQRRVLEAKAQQRGISYAEMERTAFFLHLDQGLCDAGRDRRSDPVDVQRACLRDSEEARNDCSESAHLELLKFDG